ncbi:hypothetical protein Syun_021571 [Stephania yunnanensis]|uniref:Uncharacterized protein n=1 Tax=Stephania yunnanensis TaxID=152371 RepID=A0AAP0NQS9_9MAGN
MGSGVHVGLGRAGPNSRKIGAVTLCLSGTLSPQKSLSLDGRSLSLSLSHTALSPDSLSLRNPYLPKNPSLSTARSLSLSLSHRSLCHRSLSRAVHRSLSSQTLPPLEFRSVVEPIGRIQPSISTRSRVLLLFG